MNLTIATNDSILPSDSTMELLQEKNITIRISDYGLFPLKIENLIKKCKVFGVKYSLYEFASGIGQWHYLGGIDTPRTDNDELVKKIFKHATLEFALH